MSIFRVGVLAALSVGAALGVNIYTEGADAGQSIASAAIANTLPGGTTLDAIRGNLGAGDADIFRVFILGGQVFSATTTASSLSFNNFDMQLFLFNSAGVGVYANDDDPNSPPQSTLGASIAFTPNTPGIYYLALSGSGYLPVSAGGFIFPVSGGLLDQSGGTNGNVGPSGPGGGSALSGWSSTSSETGAYEIVLTGAQFVPSAAVPEPSSALLIGVGFGALLLLRRRRS